jgi:hypothetical protein
MTTTTTYLSASIQLADPIPSLSPSHADRVTTALPRRIDSSGDDLESPCGFGCPKLLVGDAPLPQVRRVEHAAGRCGLQIRTTSPAAITSSLVPSSYHTGDTSSPAATAHARCARRRGSRAGRVGVRTGDPKVLHAREVGVSRCYVEPSGFLLRYSSLHVLIDDYCWLSSLGFDSR